MLNHSTYPTNQETTHTLELKRLRLISSYSNLLLCSTDDPQRPLLLTLPSYMPYLQKDSKQKTFPLKGPVTYLSLKCPGLIKCYSIDNSSTYIAAFDQFHMLTIFKTKGPINSWRIVYTHPLGSKILAASWFSPSKKFTLENVQQDNSFKPSNFRLTSLHPFPSKLPTQEILISFTEMGMFFGWIPTRASILLHKLRVPSHIHPSPSISSAPPLFHVAAVHISFSEQFLIIAQIKGMPSLGVWTLQLSSTESLANSDFHCMLPFSSTLSSDDIIFSHVQIIPEANGHFYVLAATQGEKNKLLLWNNQSILKYEFTSPCLINDLGYIQQILVREKNIFVASDDGVALCRLAPVFEVTTWITKEPTLDIAFSPHGLFLISLHSPSFTQVHPISHIWTMSLAEKATDSILNQTDASDVIFHTSADNAHSILHHVYTQLLPHLHKQGLSHSEFLVSPSSSTFLPSTSSSSPAITSNASSEIASSKTPFYESPFFQSLLHFQLRLSIHLSDPSRHLITTVLLHILFLSNVYSSVFEWNHEGPQYQLKLQSHVNIISLFPITRWWFDFVHYAVTILKLQLQHTQSTLFSGIFTLFLHPLISKWMHQVHVCALYVHQAMDEPYLSAFLLKDKPVHEWTNVFNVFHTSSSSVNWSFQHELHFWIHFSIPKEWIPEHLFSTLTTLNAPLFTFTLPEFTMPCNLAFWLLFNNLQCSSLQLTRFMEWVRMNAWDVIGKHNLSNAHSLMQCTSCLCFTDTSTVDSTSAENNNNNEPFWQSSFTNVCICGGRWWSVPELKNN
ncbi:hypothetical protein HMI54_005050 [Coelomomyces lativittatus]|nr:hypothetical protein HMI54_005050 [Coelomomyces lativittatus]